MQRSQPWQDYPNLCDTGRLQLQDRTAPTAQKVISKPQIFRIIILILSAFLLTLWDYKIAFTVFNFAICGFYALAVGFRLLSAVIGYTGSPEIRVPESETAGLDDATVPVYTILIPLYKEANIVEKIFPVINSLDYPPLKLDVKILLEAEDHETRIACEEANLPGCCVMIVVPDGLPRTKPRACNFGLEQARGEYLVIYDAEDRPEPDQLKKAVAAFTGLPAETACLQAKLNYYNPDQNWLTSFFTLEYTVWFDLFLPGLHRLACLFR